MSWITVPDQPASLEAVLARRPELVSRYREFYRSLWTEGLLPHRILELTRLRIAAIHDCEQEWALRDAAVALHDDELDRLRRGDVAAFSADEQAALALAEAMPFAHAQISDAEVAQAQRRFGAPGAVTLLTALAFFDVTCRLKIGLEVASLPGAYSDPPLRDGALI